MKLKQGYIPNTGALTAVVATLLTILEITHGLAQDSTFPEIICTVNPAILPARLPFSTNSTTENPPSFTKITAYVSDSTLLPNGNITFTRTFPTGNELAIPEGVLIDRTDTGFRIVLPNFKNTTGIYTLALDSVSGRISTSIVLHAADSDPKPSKPTATFNVGDNAQLRVIRNNLMGLRWIRTANETNLRQGSDTDILNVEGVTDDEVYESFVVGRRHEPHSVLRLIVRDCPDGLWGPNGSCANKCPICYSGGICDAKTGECICAPGFSGINCENAHGRNSFGQHGQFNCSDAEASPDCGGILFCQADPYGCTCAAGFRGFGCNEECDPGYFGADCLQQCHCKDNQLCAKDTGRCDGPQNDCKLDYTGSNCQEKIKILINDSGALGLNTGNTATIRCLSFLSSMSSEITLILPNGDIITPRTTGPVSPAAINGLTAEFDIRLESANQTFTCVVQTNTETVNKSAVVRAFVPPQLHDPPSASLRPTSPTNVFVVWSPWEEGYDFGDGPVISYLVQYRKADTNATFTTFFNGPTNSVAISGLERETKYEVVVVTVRPGEGGEGPQSQSTFVTTRCTVPTGIPNITEVLRGMESFTLQWQLPSRDTWGCSKVTTILFYQGATRRQITLPSNGESMTQNFTVSDLAPCAEYSVVLWLSNSGGRDGPQTDRVPVTVGGAVPGIVTGVTVPLIRPTRLKLAWNAPQTGCDVIEYNVTYKLVNFDQCNQTVADMKWKRKRADRRRLGLGSEPGGSPGKELLLPHSTYNVTITASSLDGIGETLYLQQVTSSTYPSTGPSNITVTDIEEESMSFKWAPVLCGSRHGLIDNYTARLTDEIGGKVVTRHVGAHLHGVTYINLSSCTNYSFVIRGDVGDQPGPFSDPLAVATPIGVPDPVRELRAFAPRADFIYVSWERPNNTRCDLVYHVEYSLSVRDQCIRHKRETIMYDKWTSNMDNRLEGLEPFSTYTIYVTASSLKGNGTRAAVVATTKQTAPGPVANVTAHSITAHNITFEWEAPSCGQQHGIIEGYHYILNSSDVIVHEGTTSPSDTIVTFDDLEGCTSYVFQVRAWTREGNGTFDRSVSAVTGVSVPDTIGELHVESDSPESFHVSWIPPMNAPCPISNYIVTHALINKEQCREMNPDVTRRTISVYDVTHVIRNLSPYSTYMISVTAETEGGVGDAVTVIKNTTSDVPGQIKMVTLADKSNSSLSFEWEPLACGYKRGPITGYSYLVMTQDGEEVVEDVTAMSHVTIRDLKPCSTYEVLVKSLNDYDNRTGLYSPKANGTTSAARPDKVKNVVIDIGVTSATIQWSPLNNFTCVVQSYSIYLLLLNPRKCGRVADVQAIHAGDASQTEFMLDDLLPYSIYYVYIEASTSAGPGERTEDPLTTLQGVPEMPKGVQLSENVPGSLSFQWRSLECMESNGIVQGYNYMLLHNDEEVLTNDNVTDTEYTVFFQDDVIAPCTEYVFKVRGYNSDGYGDFAPAIRVTTTPAVPPAVENVIANDVDDDPTKLFVHWELPSADTCRIQDFLVMYGVVSLDNCHDDLDESLQQGTSSIILTNNTAIVLDELHPNTLYNVTITARTAAGRGDNVSVVHHTPEAPPSAPPRVHTFPALREGTLYFSWEPLPCDEQNGIMTGYNVTLEGRDFFVTEEVSLDQMNKQFDTGLLPCTEYEFRVNGINRIGEGPRSRPEVMSTVSVPPDPVQTLRAQSILDDPTVLNITWSMPSNQICPIDNYTITTSLIRRLQCTSVNVLKEDRVIVAGTEHSFRQMDLFPATLYNVTISAATEAGMGGFKSYVASTSESAPTGPPINVTLRDAAQRNLTFTWDDPYCVNRNGEISGYRFYLMDEGNGTVNGETMEKEVTIPGLVPYNMYAFRVSAMTMMGIGPYSVMVTGKTMSGVPTMPRELDVTSKTRNSLYVEWQKPQPSRGMIIGYKLAYWRTDNNGKDNRSVAINGSAGGYFAIQQNYNITDLLPNTRYSLQVQARTDIGFGAWSRPTIIARTDEGIPSAPVDFTVVDRMQTRLRLTWKEPDQPNGMILNYNVIYKAIEKPFDPSFLPGDDITISLNQYSINLLQLDPATKYEISIFARTSAGSGPQVTIHDYTRPPRPKSPRKPQHMKSDSKLTVYLQLAPVEGDFSAYHVSVKRTPEEKLNNIYRRSVIQLSNYLDNSEDYITAEFSKDNLPENFTVGDNKTYGGYYNAPLVPDSQYSISFCTVSRTSKDTESSCSEPVEVKAINSDRQQTTTMAIPFDLMAIVAGILFVIIVTFVIVALIRKRRVSRSVNVTEEIGMSYLIDVQKSKTNGLHKGSPIKRSTGAIRNKPRMSTSPMGPNKGWRPPTPISIPNIPKYIKQRKADGEKGFTRDYDSMPAGQTYPWEVAKIIANKTKNRYANIIAYDHSRVILEPYDDVPHSDYVNANYVDGYKTPNKYIASQGPNQASTVDFWRMIWQEKVPKVIMLTNIVENGKKKCEKYWPCGIKRYGEVVVTMVQESVKEYYTERAFNMEHEYIGEQRQVKQFHFTAWPDMGLPESPTPLLFFMQKAKDYNPMTIRGPTVVHCSAGVGRTGTYLAIDAALDMALADRKINVLDYVYRMRQRRIKMVQTQDQYMFIYEVLLEALLCGDTVFPSENFSDGYSDLKRNNPLTDKPYIEEQLRALDVMSTMTSEDNARGGRAPDNMEKNRYQHLIPIDKYRPYLMTQWKSRTNYINATFLDTFRQKDGFIATQMPLVTTTIDFWRMVYDYKSNVIVMLNRLDLLDCAQYWPDTGTLEYGPFDVELMSAEECGETIIRTFKLKHMDNRIDSRIVHQYQYLGWPERETFPASPSSLLALIELVQTGQRMAGNGPMTVHCMDGVSRTGLFCSIIAAMARLKAEDMVDVFHSVKKLRKARAGMVCTKEHYVYCYNTMLTHLESNQTYVNYK